MLLFGKTATQTSAVRTNSRKRAEYGFGEYSFQTLNSVSFSGLTEFRGANSVSSSLSLLFVCKRELTEFVAELTEFAAELSEAQ